MKKLIVLSLVLLLLSGCRLLDKQDDAQPEKELQSDLEDLEDKVKDLEEKLAEKEEMEIKILDIDTSKMGAPKNEQSSNSFELILPDDGDTFGKLPVLFKGVIDGEAESVTVIATGGDGPHADSYKDVYKLKDFKKGDDTFTYRASPEWDNLAIGENEYEFEVLFEGGETLTEEMTINYIYDGDGEIVFDGCGDIAKYKGKSWFDNLKKQFSKLGVENFNSAIQLDSWLVSEDRYAISEMCYAKNGGVVLFMMPGEYCELGSVYRYQTETGVLEVARTNAKEGCVGTLHEFLKRAGNIIPITANFGDAGCSYKEYYNYDFIRNILNLHKTFRQCDSEEGEWRYYKDEL